jgi:hypothetical protein
MVFKSSSLTGQYAVNFSILACKRGTLQIGPQNKMAIFSNMAPTVSIKFQKFMDISSLNIGGTFRNITVHAIGTQMQN